VPHVVVTAIGADRPGIVAAVTGVLVDQRCNLEDTSMTILGGHFAMMLVVDVPADLAADELEAALGAVTDRFGLVVAARPIFDVGRGAEAQGEEWEVSVYGADRPGIVHQVTALLAERGVNVVDLTTRVIGDPDRPVYAMLLGVTVPPGTDMDALGEDLRSVAGELGVECSLHPAEADIL